MKRVFAVITLTGFALLFALVSNLYQPTMEFNLHCTVHSRVIEAFGGQCNAGSSMGLFTSIAAIFGTTTLLFAVALFFARATQIFFNALAPTQCAAVRIAASPPHTLENYYHRGIAPSTKFL